MLRDPLAPPDCQQYENEAENGNFQDFAGTEAPQVDSHQECDRDGHRNGECPPRTVFEGIDHDQSNDSEKNNEDRDNGGVGDDASNGSGFFLGHLSQRFAVAADGEEKNHEVLHAARENGSGQHPQSSWKIAELGGQNRSHQRARPGDRSEVVPENDPLVGHQEVAAIFEALRGGGAKAIEGQNFGSDEFAVKTISQRVAAGGSRHQP